MSVEEICNRNRDIEKLNLLFVIIIILYWAFICFLIYSNVSLFRFITYQDPPAYALYTSEERLLGQHDSNDCQWTGDILGLLPTIFFTYT